MDALAVIINSLLYVFLFYYTWKKNKHFGPSEGLLSIYVLVSIFCIIHYYSDQTVWSLDLFRFIYLFLVFLIFYLPISSDNKLEVYSSHLSSPILYTSISWFYILISLYSCIIYIPQLILILKNPEWAELYDLAHEEKESNIFIKIANLFFHLRYVGIVLFFSFLKYNKSKFFIILLGLAAFLPIVVVSMLSASRGAIVALVFSLFIAFKIFEPSIENKIKKKFYGITFLVLPILVIYFIAVSISRFDTGMTAYESSSDSYVIYLGHSMLTFNYGIMDSITGFSNGGYLLGIEEKLDLLKGTHFGSSFMTFIGCIYLDFGFIGTVLFACIFSFLITRIIKKKERGIPELFVILTYIMFLFNGVFVVGKGYGREWVEVVVLYSLLKILEILFKKTSIKTEKN